MSDNEGYKQKPDTWKLDHWFRDADGERIICDEQACTIGSYLLEINQGESYGPACTKCEFTGNLADVFNPEEPRFEPGAPECFKKAAALVLKNAPNSLLERAIRIGRPDTARMIDSYVTTETSLQ